MDAANPTASPLWTRRTVLSGVAACIAAASATAGSAQTDNVALPCSAAANDSAAPMLYAEDLGYFKSAGLNVAVTLMNNATTALAGGAIVIVAMPVSQVAIARDKGVPFTMVAPLSLYVSTTPDHALIVLKNAAFRRAADLNGKTIATRDLNNMSYFAARAWIDKNGGDSKTIKWYELSDTLAVAALQAGRVDAASISEPALDPALAAGDVRVLAPVFDAIALKFLVAGCVTTDAFAKAHPEVIRKFADVMAKTAVWANANQAKSGAILAKYAQAPVPPGGARAVYAERLQSTDVQPVLDLLFSAGQLKAPLRASDLFSSVVTTT